MKNNKVTISFIFSILILMMFLWFINVDLHKSIDSKQHTLTVSSISSQKASNLLAVNCYICHDPKTNSHDEMLAPPLAGIKKRYIKATTDREAFIKYMTSFVSNPTEENALMKGPVRRFGLMPKTALDSEQISAIVTYIYDNEIPEPTWFVDHEKQMHKNQ